MIFGPFSLDAAQGAVVAHTHRLPGRVLRKGTRLDEPAIAALRAAGHITVIAAKLDPDDVLEDEAARRLAASLAVDGLEAGPATTGRVNLVVRQPGLLRVRAEAINAINRLDEALTVATLPDWATGEPGDLAATIKVIPFAVAAATLRAAEHLARDLAPVLTWHPFRPFVAGLVLSRLPGLKDSVIAGTIEAMQGRVAQLGGTMLPPVTVAHDTASIADALAALRAQGAGMLLVAGASATVDRRDIGPAAVVACGGEISHFGMPVDPGNLICLGRIGAGAAAIPALVLPGCARSPKPNGIDWVMQRLAAGLPVGPDEIMAMGVGGLIKESDARPMPRVRPRAAPRATVAAIVLAAGASRRALPRHKLLTRDAQGVAMIARTVDNVLASRARPVLVVTGHRGEEITAALAGRPVTLVRAADHDRGLSASLRAGLAALPASVPAALVCLGDMPMVEPAVLDRLIAAWDPDEGRLAVQPAWQGRPGNPVLFDRRLFDRLTALSGDTGARAMLAAMEHELTLVEVGSDSVLRDFDTAEALDTWVAPRTTDAA